MKVTLGFLDRPTYAVIAARRAATDLGERHDILSLLLQARTRGRRAADRPRAPRRADHPRARRPRDDRQQLAWAFERLVRIARRLRRACVAAVRSGDDEESDAAIEAMIVEAMRARPVIPIIGRRVMVPWRMGDYELPAETPVLVSILLLHHREDLYPDPFAFRPERWTDRKPGTYEWLPFGGGIRRCLGAALAMAEMRARAARDRAAAGPRGRPPRARARASPQRDDDPGPRRARGGQAPSSLTRSAMTSPGRCVICSQVYRTTV